MSGAEHVEVALALIRWDGQFLVTRRPVGAHLAGCLEFPGGKIEPGEDAADAAVREVREELGIVVVPLRVRSAIAFTYPGRTVRLTPVECDCVGSERPTPAGVDHDWLTPEEMDPVEFPPANRPLLAALQAGR